MPGYLSIFDELIFAEQIIWPLVKLQVSKTNTDFNN